MKKDKVKSGTAVAGALGILGAAMGCSVCFPTLAGLGGAVGLGFLGRYEGTIVRVVIPVLASGSLAVNLFGNRARSVSVRILGASGPLLVLVATVLLIGHKGWQSVFYAGVVFMALFSAWELLERKKSCSPCDEVRSC